MVFVDDLEHPVLGADDHHHLAKALRVPSGAEIVASDGAGRWRVVRFEPAAAGVASETIGDIVADEPPPWQLAVAFAPVKGERPEWTVQKLTELGVDRIIPLVSERSIVRWDAKRWAKQEEKWRRIAREASMQSRRVWLPTIEALTPLASFVSANPEVVLADPDGESIDPTDRIVAIGPEGGWGRDEMTDRPLVSLPGGVLRAETAALTAASIMAMHRELSASNRK